MTNIEGHFLYKYRTNSLLINNTEQVCSMNNNTEQGRSMTNNIEQCRSVTNNI